MPTDDENDLGELYFFNNESEPQIWANLKSISEAPVRQDDEVDYIQLRPRIITGTCTFNCKLTYMSRKFFRPVRRWSRKKAQQKKRKIAKEKKYGILHERS